MSMYTQLLEAAWRDRPGRTTSGADTSQGGALDEVMRRRRQLGEGLQAGESAETVPAQLALQVAYDVALMDLARSVGIETEPSRFEQPQLERERLEDQLNAQGVILEAAAEGEQPVANQH